MPTSPTCCDHCGSTDWRACLQESALLALPPPFRVVRCVRCGLRFLDPQPDEQDFASLYDETYFIGEEQYAEHILAKQEDFGRQLDLLACHARAGQRLLEIGCALGHFLAEAESRGFRVTGVEVSRWAAAAAHRKFGTPVIVGNIEQLAFPASSFQVVVLSHVLEHLRNPRRVLETVRKCLAPGGVLLAEVPNQFDSLWVRLLGPWIRYRARHRRPFLVHTHFFTPHQFVNLVRDVGFEPRVVQTMRPTYPAEPGRIPGGHWVRGTIDRIGGAFGMGPICTVLAVRSADTPWASREVGT